MNHDQCYLIYLMYGSIYIHDFMYVLICVQHHVNRIPYPTWEELGLIHLFMMQMLSCT